MTVITMSRNELTRLRVLIDVADGRLSVADATGLIGVGRRQIYRLLHAFRADGADGLISRKRGGPSNRALGSVFRETVLAIVRERYADFGPTLAAEKLSELHGLDLGVETLRRITSRRPVRRPSARISTGTPKRWTVIAPAWHGPCRSSHGSAWPLRRSAQSPSPDRQLRLQSTGLGWNRCPSCPGQVPGTISSICATRVGNDACKGSFRKLAASIWCLRFSAAPIIWV
jgi:transposase